MNINKSVSDSSVPKYFITMMLIVVGVFLIQIKTMIQMKNLFSIGLMLIRHFHFPVPA